MYFAGVTRCSGHFQAQSGRAFPHHPVFLSGLSLDISVPVVFGVSTKVIVIDFGLKERILAKTPACFVTGS
jgi:hypothetical protein